MELLIMFTKLFCNLFKIAKIFKLLELLHKRNTLSLQIAFQRASNNI